MVRLWLLVVVVLAASASAMWAGALTAEDRGVPLTEQRAELLRIQSA